MALCVLAGGERDNLERLQRKHSKIAVKLYGAFRRVSLLRCGFLPFGNILAAVRCCSGEAFAMMAN